MKLNEVLKKLRVPIGLTSAIDGLMSGNLQSIDARTATLKTSLSDAKKRLFSVKEKRKNAKTDSGYWGYNSQVGYWNCIVNLLEAAEITGMDSLPDVEIPNIDNMVVMDSAYALEQFGEKVLAEAKRK